MDLQKIYEDAKFSTDPIENFLHWQKEAKTKGDKEDACTLTTSSKDGVPSGRMVLLKYVKNSHFFIFTNFESAKAKDLQENPRAELVFYFHQLGRQVRIAGDVAKVSNEESQNYFSSRNIESQVASLISKQSQTLESLKALEDEFTKKLKQYKDKEIECPKNWGGFAIKPTSIEFFIYGEHRLNIRENYKLVNNTWQSEFLWP